MRFPLYRLQAQGGCAKRAADVLADRIETGTNAMTKLMMFSRQSNAGRKSTGADLIPVTSGRLSRAAVSQPLKGVFSNVARKFAFGAMFLSLTGIAPEAPLAAREPSNTDLAKLDAIYETRDGFSPFTKQEAFDVACKSGRNDACERAQQNRNGKFYSYARAQDFLKKACAIKKKAEVCFTAGLWYEHAIGSDIELGDARQQYRMVCKRGHAPSCRGLARLTKDDDANGVQEKLGFYDQACTMGSAAACSDHSIYLIAREPTREAALAQSIGRALKACEGEGALADCELAYDTARKMMQGQAHPFAKSLVLQKLGPQASAKLSAALPKMISQYDGEHSVAALGAFRAAGVNLATAEAITAAQNQPAVLAVVMQGIGTGSPEETQAMLSAVRTGNQKTFEMLLDRGADINATRQSDGESALHIVAESGDLSFLDMLLARGATVDIRNKKGVTPLMLAARKGDGLPVARLLKARADPNLRTVNGANALHAAVIAPKAEATALLLREGANPNVQAFDAKASPLMLAASGGKGAAFSLLLAQGAIPDLKDANGETALFYAIRAEQDGLATALLDAGASPSIISDNGETPAQLFALVRQKRQAQAAAVKAEEERIVALAKQREEAARQRSLAQAEANKKKKGGGMFGSLLGAVGGAIIGTDLGLDAGAIGQLSSAMAAVGAAAENADDSDGISGALGFLGAVTGMTAGVTGDTGLAAMLGSVTGGNVSGGGAGGLGNMLAQGLMDGGDLETAVLAGALAGLVAMETDNPAAVQGLAQGLAGAAQSNGQSTSSGPIADLNQRTKAAASKEGYRTFEYTYTCPAGTTNTVTIPYKTERQKQLRMELARTAGCNKMEEAQQVMNQCQAEFGNAYCQ